jgi:hypothetical protein
MEKDIVNIGKSVVIKGELNGSEDLTIEGHVEGTIQLRDHVLEVLLCCRLHLEDLGERPVERGAAAGVGGSGSVGALTAGGAGATLELAVVTTFCAGMSRLWPTAFLLARAWGGAADSATADSAAAGSATADSATTGVDTWLSLFSHGKWCSSKGRLVFQTAKTRWSSLRMQWPMATSPRVPLALRRA